MMLVVSVGLAFTINATAAHAALLGAPAVHGMAAAPGPLLAQLGGTSHNAAADVEATAAPGEGVIRIVTRACGTAPTAAHWQAVAVANAITPPMYLVLLGQRLTVSCSVQTSTSPPESTPVQSSAGSPPASSGWANPLPGACITDSFGYRAWRGYVHQGLDLGADSGTPVRAAADGQVTRSGWIWSGYGISVTLAHGDDWHTHYAHLSRAAVSAGQWVSAGQVIGYVGATGQVTGPHLHLEVSSSYGILGAQRDPLPFMWDRGVDWGWC